ncbi:MAG TPA: response regulator transcription factor [Anaerolineae bacterium]
MRVLLVDDHPLLVEGLSNLLQAHQITVVGIAADGRQALHLARTLQPDVILMDIAMPGCDGLTATRWIKAEIPEAKIVILTGSTESQDLFEAIKSGAYGYLLKTIEAGALVEAIEGVSQGIPPLSAGLAGKLLGEFQRLAAADAPPRPVPAPPGQPASEPAAPGLTERQTQVLALVAKGLSYKEVGIRLGLSARTVKYHMAEVMQRLHLANRAQVLAFAARIGLDEKGFRHQ